jgi:hypothetical protein
MVLSRTSPILITLFDPCIREPTNESTPSQTDEVISQQKNQKDEKRVISDMEGATPQVEEDNLEAVIEFAY